ncbi:hypothetical protein ACFL2V_08645 [Pseudomonadota bacterium]
MISKNILFILSTFSLISGSFIITNAQENLTDFDPLVDIELIVTIETIRSLEKEDPQVRASEVIDLTTDPDFYLKLSINGHVYTSQTWENTKYLYEPVWQIIHNVPDDQEEVSIILQLWDAQDGSATSDRLCDISEDTGNTDDAYDVELTYNIKTGHWSGDDYVGDQSGYGRLNGCDDGTIYQQDRDCELWFDIYQTDYDNDKIPYYTESNIINTDPTRNDAMEDPDNDSIPTYWEWTYDYNPGQWDDHTVLDPDIDGIQNNEEYRTSQWYSDPYVRDIFIELDHMAEGPNGESTSLPEISKELLYTAYNRQNVVYHLDDGTWDETCSDLIPFDEITECSWSGFDELDQIYVDYFIQNEEDAWRRGVFHYGVIIYQSSIVNGNMFGANRFQISAKGMEGKMDQFPYLKRDIIYASAYMHEAGHTFSFGPIPGHNRLSYYPWQLGFWLSRAYKSCMNYGYMFTVVDYSDGSRTAFGSIMPDYNDWERMDLTSFQRDW